MILTQSSFDVLRKELFKTLEQSQVDGLNYLTERCTEFQISYPEAAYVLATAYHETATTMLPIKERGSDAYLRSKKYYPHIGYGYVQLTWEANFRRVGKLIGVDLLNYPEKALEKEIASEILIKGMVFGWFTGVGFHRKCPVYRYNLDSYVRARKIVNGTDKAEKIAEYAMVFEKALRS